LPKIILTEDINPEKRRVTGVELNWPRATIDRISAKRGNDDWYRSTAIQATKKAQPKRGPGRPKKEE